LGTTQNIRLTELIWKVGEISHQRDRVTVTDVTRFNATFGLVISCGIGVVWFLTDMAYRNVVDGAGAIRMGLYVAIIVFE